MKTLLITIAAAALVAAPLAAQAQDRGGWQGDGQDGDARPAASYSHDADAGAHDDRRGDVRYGRADQDRYGRDGFAQGRVGQDRFDGERGYYRDRDGGRFRGEVGVGFGYGGNYGGGYNGGSYYGGGGYSGGGYYDAYPGDYGADDAYSYPDRDGTYQPFGYAYSSRDDAYYADQGGANGGEGYDRYQAAPNAGWSAGAGQDCGQWVWREGRSAYQWVPAPCR
jgi:Ni/Co efflux regulator RcnB